MFKRTLTWLVLAFVVYWIVVSPAQVAQTLRNVGYELHRGAESVITVIEDL